jgi:hypothetical protein
MFPDLFRSLQPLYNPIGFGASDFAELGVAALLVALVLSRGWLEPFARKLAARPAWAMLVLALLPVALRLALFPQHPVPHPAGADDFSYILLGDTLAHLRLANPPHPLHQFFEGVYILQQPTYSSIFPPGQGLVLALGQVATGLPWAGVVLSVAAMCALCYWMLRAWTTPAWALAGGLLAVAEFGPLSQWMNSYWGGAVTACSGCLVFGALPRLRAGGRIRDAALLGVGLGLHALTRPFESVFVALAVILFFVPALRQRSEWRRLLRLAAFASLAAAPALLLILFHNRAVTGSFTTLPYALGRYQYGMPASFTTQPNPVPHVPLTPEQETDYRAQATIHGQGTDTVESFLGRLVNSVRYYRFFFFAPLYLVLPLFLLSIREYRFLWVVLVLLALALGTNFYPYFYPHYIAAATCLFLLMTVKGLERLRSWRIRAWPAGREAAGLILLLCAGHFFLWYGIHAIGDERLLSGLGQYESWDFINWGDAQGRVQIDKRLAKEPGNQLVFVHYGPRHRYYTWIHNAADIDRARVVWALDLGPEEDGKLIRYYPGRTAWLIEPDTRPPNLTPYQPEPDNGITLEPVR